MMIAALSDYRFGKIGRSEADLRLVADAQSGSP